MWGSVPRCEPSTDQPISGNSGVAYYTYTQVEALTDFHEFALVVMCITDSRTFTGRKEMFYLTTHSTHFIYGYMASDIW